MAVNRKSVGLYIADHSITVAELTETKGAGSVTSLGRITLAPGIVEAGRIKDEKRLAAAMRQVFSKAEPRAIMASSVIFGLPESQAYVHVFRLPAHEPAERGRLALQEARASIPLEASDLLFAYSVLVEDESGEKEILLVASSRAVVLEWWKFFQNNQLEVETFDIRSLAVRRGLFVERPTAPVCVIDMGATTTSLVIFDGAGLRYSYAINIAGDAFTREIASSLKMTLEEAEEAKLRFGITNDDNRVLHPLVKSLEPVRDEVKASLNYFQSQTKQPVGEVVLVGGSSRLKGLVDYFSINLSVPVRLGEPVLNLVGRAKAKTKAKSTKRSVKTPAENENNFLYIEAIGLARRAFAGWWQDSDPSISLVSAEDSAAANNVLAQVERTIKKEEIIIERTLQRVLSRKARLFGLLAVGAVALSLVYWYWSYLANAPVNIASPSPKIENSAVPPLVFPENPIENTAPEPTGSAENQSPEPPVEQNPQVLITDTPTGWLNVRSGPGTNYPILTKVYPGKSYPLLQEAEKWYKIKADLDIEGWVTDQYAAKQ